MVILIILAGIFYVKDNNRDNLNQEGIDIENQDNKEVKSIEEIIENEDGEDLKEPLPSHLQGKYGRTYDRETHILTFYVDGEKINEVDLFKVAPITMEGRENLGPISGYPYSHAWRNGSDRYKALFDDINVFNINDDFSYLILDLDFNQNKKDKYFIVNYSYGLYKENNGDIGTIHRALVFNQDGTIEQELVIKVGVERDSYVSVKSVHPEFKYIYYILGKYIDAEDNEGGDWEVYVVSDSMEENLFKKITKEEYYVDLWGGYVSSFDKTGSIKFRVRSKKGGDKSIVELDFDKMEIKVLENYDN